MSDFQVNEEGIEVGDKVRVKQMEQLFYHLPKFKEEGLDATGFEGTVKELVLKSKKFDGADLTANRPVVVSFTEPHKFNAHFEFSEVEKVR